jgi:hypothetical protein
MLTKLIGIVALKDGVAQDFHWEMQGTFYEQRVTRTMSGFSTLPMCTVWIEQPHVANEMINSPIV